MIRQRKSKNSSEREYEERERERQRDERETGALDISGHETSTKSGGFYRKEQI